MHQLTRNAAACLAAAILCGCGAKQSPGGPAAAAPTAPAAKRAAPGAQLSRTMVSAVAASKPSAVPVQVRFALHSRPSAGQPLDVQLVLVPTSGAIDRIAGKIVTDDDLDFVDGAEIAATEHPAEGVPIDHPLRVLPRHDGVFTLNVVVTVVSGSNTANESFSMPLIVGEGIGKPPPAATPVAAATHSAAVTQ